METRDNYTCPMHPNIQESRPGLCPDCGMSLVKLKQKNKPAEHKHDGEHGTAFNKHAGHKTQSFLHKFAVSLILSVPIVLYSDLPQKLFGVVVPLPPLQIPSSILRLIIEAGFGSVVFFYGGWIFLASAVRELRAKLPGMMTLIAIAISAAYIYSIGSIIAGGEHTLFWELATLITIMLLGHWLEMKSVQGAEGALKELSKLLPDTAEVLRDGKPVMVPLEELKEQDMVFVRPGAKIPADGVVTEGESEVDEAMITGESKPIAKHPQSEVIAGTINGDGALTIKVTKIGEHTFLAGVMRLVREAQASKSRLQLLSDKAAFYLTIVAVAGGAITFTLWFIFRHDLPFAVERLVAVLVVACPHALGLAIPLVASISTTIAARNGFLIRRRSALELARELDVVLFDKTGTLTEGAYGVADVIADQEKQNEALQLAAAVDASSEHFVSKAIVKEAQNRGLKTEKVERFERLSGKGVRGLVSGSTIAVGGEKILELSGATVPSHFLPTIERSSREGKTIIYVTKDGVCIGAIALVDIIRGESREAISSLKKMGVRTAMITGDTEDVAEWVAKELGIDEYFSRVLPGEKAEKVKLLQAKGLKVAMVGDGVNDAPALTQADIGVAIGAGTNVAIESAGIILVKNDPRDIPKIIRLSRLTYGKMIQNLFWATGYNVIALPLAAGVLASRGILLEPAFAAALMSLSTVIVAANALLLRKAGAKLA
jgi:Cu2+-exporting ATPase